MDTMYVGHDPKSSSGFSSHFMMKETNICARKPPRPSRKNHDVAGGSERRWGETQQFTGDQNSFVLAGSKVSQQCQN